MARIMIADDSKAQRILYKRAIENFNLPDDVEFDEVATGDELVEKVNAENYDFIIADYNMPPGITGFEAIGRIRGKDVDTPIYLISDLDEKMGEGLAHYAGATGYISKDNFKNVLEEKIKLHLEDENDR